MFNDNTIVVPADVQDFPYMLGDGEKVTSYLTISRPRDGFYLDGVEKDLFYLAGAELDIRENPAHTRVTLHHSWARDDEGSRAYEAIFEIPDLKLYSGDGNQVSFIGWLTKMNFYPTGVKNDEGEDVNPFIGATENLEDPYENTGFPYVPPEVSFAPALTLPLRVEVTLRYNRDNVKTTFQELKTAATNRQQAFRAEREAYQQKRKAEQAERIRVRKAWGKFEAFINEFSNQYGDDETLIEGDKMQDEVTKTVDALTPEKKTVLADAFNECLSEYLETVLVGETTRNYLTLLHQKLQPE